MNYKIRITAENQAIVKRIADENGMNSYKWDFDNFDKYYIISDNKFIDIGNDKSHIELTTEQFVQMFDKKETELDKWLKETKAKNLSRWELQSEIDLIMDKGVLMQLQGSNNYTKAQILFNQWNNPTQESPKVETEWQPKRGDRVLVWENSEEPLNAIYLETVIGCTQPFLVVDAESEEDFLKGNEFDFVTYKHMKPLPIEQQTEDKVEVASEIYAEQNAKDDNISYHNLFSPLKYAFINGAKWQSEQPKETDFKSKFEKAIELLNEKYKDYSSSIRINANELEFQKAGEYKLLSNELSDILNQIKQL
jgi:hypothetical protein